MLVVVSIPGLPSLDRPKCPTCGRTLDLSFAIRLEERTTNRFDGQVPHASGLCACARPFAIEDDGTVRPASYREMAMLIVSRPELADILLQLAADKLDPVQFAAVAATFAEIHKRYPRQKRNKPPG
jgi:hypothetical protein